MEPLILQPLSQCALHHQSRRLLLASTGVTIPMEPTATTLSALILTALPVSLSTLHRQLSLRHLRPPTLLSRVTARPVRPARLLSLPPRLLPPLSLHLSTRPLLLPRLLPLPPLTRLLRPRLHPLLAPSVASLPSMAVTLTAVTARSADTPSPHLSSAPPSLPPTGIPPPTAVLVSPLPDPMATRSPP